MCAGWLFIYIRLSANGTVGPPVPDGNWMPAPDPIPYDEGIA